jgi:hypothetical protein
MEKLFICGVIIIGLIISNIYWCYKWYVSKEECEDICLNNNRAINRWKDKLDGLIYWRWQICVNKRHELINSFNSEIKTLASLSPSEICDIFDLRKLILNTDDMLEFKQYKAHIDDGTNLVVTECK